MEALVRHLVEPIVSHPDAVSLQTVEGEAVVMLELVVHPDDRERVDGDKGRTLRAIRNILSAAAGSRKATLDLVEQHGARGTEE
ncbi:MAG: KH domain-containing protein [Myxococcota bacterium]